MNFNIIKSNGNYATVSLLMALRIMLSTVAISAAEYTDYTEAPKEETENRQPQNLGQSERALLNPSLYGSAEYRDMAREGIEESVERLPEILPVAEGELRTSLDRGDYCAFMVTEKPRIRKLLIQGRDTPQQVLPLLRKHLRDAATNFSSVRLRLDNLQRAGELDTDDAVWKEHYQKQMTAASCIYLLAELKDTRALPILADIYNRREEGEPGVVPRDFLVFAMYRICEGWPQERLTDDQADALQKVLQYGDTLAEPEPWRVPSLSYSRKGEPDPAMKSAGAGADFYEGPTMVIRKWRLEFDNGNNIIVYAKFLEEFSQRINDFVETLDSDAGL